MKRIKNKLKGIGQSLQSINLIKLINDMEEFYHFELAEEEERQEACRGARDACMRTILQHLSTFINEHDMMNDDCNDGDDSMVCYEDWILELHPDNDNRTPKKRHFKSDDNKRRIDHRFYVKDSDHRLLWNKAMDALANNTIDDDEDGRRKRDLYLSQKIAPKI